MPAGRLLLGIGSGRSGSTSLAKLFSMQPQVYMVHEHPPKLPWEPDRGRFNFHVRRFRKVLALVPYAGDVSHYWLPYLDNLLLEFPAARIIALQRDRSETIRSFETVLGSEGRGQNHWLDHHGKGWAQNPWDPCFPKYECADRKEAIGQYWEEYYAKVQETCENYPDNILLCDTGELNSPEGQARILGFCGFSNPVTASELMYNKGSTKDGSIHY